MLCTRPRRQSIGRPTIVPGSASSTQDGRTLDAQNHWRYLSHINGLPQPGEPDHGANKDRRTEQFHGDRVVWRMALYCRIPPSDVLAGSSWTGVVAVLPRRRAPWTGLVSRHLPVQRVPPV